MSPLITWLADLRTARGDKTWAPLRQECGISEATWYGHVLKHPEHAIDPVTRDRLTQLGKTRAEIDVMCGPTSKSKATRTRIAQGWHPGVPSVAEEELEAIRQACAIADDQNISLPDLAAQLHMSVDWLGELRKRAGLPTRRNTAVRSAGQRRRNECERREHPGDAHIDQLPVMGRARRHELSSQGALHRSPASVEKQLATSDARYPGWRTKRPAKARDVLHRKLYRPDGPDGTARPNYMKTFMKKARAAQTGKRPGARVSRSAIATRLAVERGPEYYSAMRASGIAKKATMQAIETAKQAKRPKRALQVLLGRCHTKTARDLVEAALDGLPGPTPPAPAARGPQPRADLKEIRTKNLTTEQIMERFHVGERHARRLRAEAIKEPTRT